MTSQTFICDKEIRSFLAKFHFSGHFNSFSGTKHWETAIRKLFYILSHMKRKKEQRFKKNCNKYFIITSIIIVLIVAKCIDIFKEKNNLNFLPSRHIIYPSPNVILIIFNLYCFLKYIQRKTSLFLNIDFMMRSQRDIEELR